jgi:hypothetical protein
MELSTTELIQRSGVSRRQIYYWINCGVPLGEQVKSGKGHKKVFTELELEICRKILAPLSDLMGGGSRRKGQALDSTFVFTRVVNAIKNKPGILGRTYIYISKTGNIYQVPIEGWVLKLRKDGDEH